MNMLNKSTAKPQLTQSLVKIMVMKTLFCDTDELLTVLTPMGSVRGY